MARAAITPSRSFTLGLVAFVVAVLYLAKEVLIPFALSILLSFLLAPLVKRLEQWGLARVPAVVCVVTLAFTVIGCIGWAVGNQLIVLADNLPAYQNNIRAKVRSFHVAEGSAVGRFQKIIEEITRELPTSQKPAPPETPPAAPRRGEPATAQPSFSARAEIAPQVSEPAAPAVAREKIEEAKENHELLPGESSAKPAATGVAADAEPVPVAIVQPTRSLSMIQAMLAPVFGILATTGIVILFVFFMLIAREDLRNRLLRLIGSNRLSTTTQALDEAAARVSRYLIMQLIVNSTYGLAVAAGLYAIGVPNAILWGLLAGLLRYIPYLGPWIAAAFPIALSLAAFDTWREPLLTAGLFIVLELLSNNVMEPLLYSSSTGISTIGILVAAVFWTWLWGSIGLVLATPLTVCIAVLGRYVPELEFFKILLADEEVLPLGAQYYQRLLAGDHEEANELVDKFLEHGSVEDLYETVLLPALQLIEQDSHRGALDLGKQEYIRESMRELIEEMPDRVGTTSVTEVAAKPASPTEAAVAQSARRCVLCLPARDEADEIASMMLSQVLEMHGHCTRFTSVKALASEMLDQVAEGEIEVVCISGVPPFAVDHARYLCKRLKSRFPEIVIIVGLWGPGGVTKKTEERLRRADADKVASTIKQAVESI